MISWLTWPVEWLARILSKRRKQKIEIALQEAGFVDAKQWHTLNRISKDEASEQLELAVTNGILEKMFLYEGHDSPITFVVPETLLDTHVLLSEIDAFSEEGRKLFVSSNFTRPVYVAPRS